MKKMLPKVLSVVKRFESNDPNEICKALHIRVVPKSHIGVKGIFISSPVKQLIVVDRALTTNEKNVVLAHELGHYFLHGIGTRIFAVDVLTKEQHRQQECEANKFAFLLIAHTCLRNKPHMIDSIAAEQRLTFSAVVTLLDEFSATNCYCGVNHE